MNLWGLSSVSLYPGRRNQASPQARVPLPTQVTNMELKDCIRQIEDLDPRQGVTVRVGGRTFAGKAGRVLKTLNKFRNLPTNIVSILAGGTDFHLNTRDEYYVVSFVNRATLDALEAKVCSTCGHNTHDYGEPCQMMRLKMEPRFPEHAFEYSNEECNVRCDEYEPRTS